MCRTFFFSLFLLALASFKSEDNCQKKPFIKANGHHEAPVDFSLQDSANKTITLSQFRGKFVVICMEASWCKPCMKEVEATKEMQKDFLGQDVVWIFISFDRDRESWDNARKTNNLGGIQLWGKPRAEDLKKTFNFDSLPYYIWVDKDGTVAVDDAPRPSVRNAKKQLKMYLKG